MPPNNVYQLCEDEVFEVFEVLTPNTALRSKCSNMSGLIFGNLNDVLICWHIFKQLL